MNLSMATDYCTDVHAFNSLDDFFNGIGNPKPYLRKIADAGFTHLHWCHHWRSDFFYEEPEMVEIGKQFQEYGLQIADIHGSEGIEKFWYSPQEYARLAGVELVKNRIAFTARFGGDAMVMHAYPLPADPTLANLLWSQLRKTLDAVQPFALERGVKIAIENLIDFQNTHFNKLPVEQAGDNRQLIADLFAAYPPEFLGLCYDPGHGNLGYDRMEMLDMFKDRLCVLHLNGNHGREDEHLNVFHGTVDWERLAKLIAASPYRKPMSLEVCMQKTYPSQEVFLQEARETGGRFSAMVEGYRG